LPADDTPANCAKWDIPCMIGGIQNIMIVGGAAVKLVLLLKR
jgi:hypothetical protein